MAKSLNWAHTAFLGHLSLKLSMRGAVPDVSAPGVNVDKGRLDVDSPGPDGQTLSKDLNHVRLDVNTCSGHIQAAGGHGDDAGVVVDSDGL